MRSPSLAPSRDPVHLVLCDFGKLGNAFVETPPVMTEGEVVEGILHGQYDTPLQVIAFDVDEGWSRDVSEDVAGLVVEKAHHEERTLPAGAQSFVKSTLMKNWSQSCAHEHVGWAELCLRSPC